MKRRFERAVNELIESDLFDGEDLSREEAEKMVMDYALTHEGYFDEIDEVKQKGEYKTRKQYADEQLEKMNDPADAVAESTEATTNSVIKKEKAAGRNRGRVDESPGTTPPRRATSSKVTVPQSRTKSNTEIKKSDRDNARTDRELLMESENEALTQAERQALEKYRIGKKNIPACRGECPDRPGCFSAYTLRRRRSFCVRRTARRWRRPSERCRSRL